MPAVAALPRSIEILATCRQDAIAGDASPACSTVSTKPAAGRLLKLITGGLRVGVSARLAKTRWRALGGLEANEIEEIWPGLAPPYEDLFAWVEGRAEKPVVTDPAPFRPAMLSHAIEERDFATLDPADFRGRVEMGRHPRAGRCRDRRGRAIASARLYSRTGEDMSPPFPNSWRRC